MQTPSRQQLKSHLRRPWSALTLVAGNQLLQLLEPLVEPSVLSGGGQVADGVGIRAALSNGGLACGVAVGTWSVGSWSVDRVQ